MNPPADGPRRSGASRDPRVVPLYALPHRTGDEPPPAAEVSWESMVTATRIGLDSLSRLQFEQAQIVELCRRPTSVTELAAGLQVPVGVARLLVSELRQAGMVTAHEPRFGGNEPSGEVLDRLLAGLRTQKD